MNKHVPLAILLIAIFFIFTACGAKEMFSPDPETRMAKGEIDNNIVAPGPEMRAVKDEIDNDIVAGVPVASDPVVTEAMSPTMNSDFNVDLPSMVANGQPTAPIPSSGPEMGYYNFAKTMYM